VKEESQNIERNDSIRGIDLRSVKDGPAREIIKQLKLETENEEQFVKRVACNFQIAWSHLYNFHKQARTELAFASGHQWDEADANILRQRNAAMTTFNRTDTLVDAVVGYFTNNRQEISFMPRETTDTAVSDSLRKVNKWIEDVSKADVAEDLMFRSAYICGLGFTDTYMDYSVDPLGCPKIEFVPVYNVLYDPTARATNLEDAKWMVRFKDVPIDEFVALYPQQANKVLSEPQGVWNMGTPTASTTSSNPINALLNYSVAGENTRIQSGVMNDPQNWNEEFGFTGGYVRVITYYYTTYETVYGVVTQEPDPTDPRGYKETLRETTDYKEAKAMAAMEYETGGDVARFYLPITKRAAMRKRVAVIAGRTVLEDGPSAAGDYHWTLQACTGKYDDKVGVFYGAVRNMIDPQQWANKFLSEIIDIFRVNSKGGPIVETGAVRSMQRFNKQWANPHETIELEEGGLAKFTTRPQGQYPASLDRLLQLAVESLPDVSGVNKELMGMADRTQSGNVEYQRKQAGMVVLATYFKAVRLYHINRGKVNLNFIQKFMNGTRVLRIDSESGSELLPVLFDEDVSTYDVVVTDSPVAPNTKEKTWQQIVQILPIVQAVLPPQVMLQLMKYSPLPAKAVEEIAAAAQQAMDMQGQIQAAAKEMAKKEAAVISADAKQNQVTVDAARASSEAKLGAMELAVRREKQLMDNQNTKIDRIVNMIGGTPGE